MKKEFQNLNIQCWEHRGGRLGRKRPFICLQAPPDACDILLAAVDELAAEQPPAQRTLTTRRFQRKKACRTIRLLLTAPTDDLEEMSLTVAAHAAVFEFTPIGLKMFRDAVLTWRNGGEDFAVRPSREKARNDKKSGEVWFWTPDTDP